MSINIKPLPFDFVGQYQYQEPVQDWQSYIEDVKQSLQGTLLSSHGKYEVENTLRKAVHRLCDERGIFFNSHDLTFDFSTPDNIHVVIDARLIVQFISWEELRDGKACAETGNALYIVNSDAYARKNLCWEYNDELRFYLRERGLA